jgi:hypothetical protein
VDRKFSLPYVWVETEEYINEFLPYQKNIDSVFLGLPYVLGMYSHATCQESAIRESEERNNKDRLTLDFLKKSKGVFKRIIVYNPSVFTKNLEQLQWSVENLLIPFLYEYEIEGLITTGFNIAKEVKSYLPNIEIQTSCNSYQFGTQFMRHWKEQLGVELFNPPREILRMPRLLKEMKDEGYKIKAIVNEACLFGCPHTITHIGANAQILSYNSDYGCKENPTNLFKSNWVIPRWLPQLDEYVDVYKIAGRAFSLATVSKAFKSYLNLDDTSSLFDVVKGCTVAQLKGLYNPIPCNEIHDKLLTCECKECSTCKLCEQLANKYLKEDTNIS